MEKEMLEELKLFLRVDFEDFDTEINEFQKSAEEYLTNAGVTKNYDSSLYKQAIKVLVAYWFERKFNVNIDKSSKVMSWSLEGIIAQLRGISGSI
ncbi:head-tail connector protein [Paraclostridium sordellii]|uniref:head-tail connector protein n=1 Tax=Paraclostridium sordellii TaxID=1505 RepID=UPI001897C80C|nr:head-tail connector protein [Paeniclostridium sordellii]